VKVPTKGSCNRVRTLNGCGVSELFPSSEKPIGHISSKGRSPNSPLLAVKEELKAREGIVARGSRSNNGSGGDSIVGSMKRSAGRQRKPTEETPCARPRVDYAALHGRSVAVWLAGTRNGCGASDDSDAENSLAPGAGLARERDGSVSNGTWTGWSDAPRARHVTNIVGTRGRIGKPQKCCSLASSDDGLCRVGRTVSGAARPALHSDAKRNRQLIENVYSEPRTGRGPPDRCPGWPQASSYVNRKAKQSETYRANVALKNRLLSARPTVPRIRPLGPRVAR
jgi:hypothetical protein